MFYGEIRDNQISLEHQFGFISLLIVDKIS